MSMKIHFSSMLTRLVQRHCLSWSDEKFEYMKQHEDEAREAVCAYFEGALLGSATVLVLANAFGAFDFLK